MRFKYHIDRVTTWRSGVIGTKSDTKFARSFPLWDPRGVASLLPSGGAPGESPLPLGGEDMDYISRAVLPPVSQLPTTLTEKRIKFVTIKWWYFSRLCFDLDAVFDVLSSRNILQCCFIIVKRTTLSFYWRIIIDMLFHHHLMWNCDGIRQWTIVPIVIWLFAKVDFHRWSTSFVCEWFKARLWVEEDIKIGRIWCDLSSLVLDFHRVCG